MGKFRFRHLSSQERLTSKGTKQSQKLKSSSESNSCHCEANKLHSGVPMKNLLAQEMSETKKRSSSPSIIARLMGLDVLPSPSSSSSAHRQQLHKSVENQLTRSGEVSNSYDESLRRRRSKSEQKFKDVFEVSETKKAEKVKANLTKAETAFIRQKFMEAKRLSTDEKLRHSKEFNDALEALDSNKDLLLKFLQHPDSLFTKHLHDLQTSKSQRNVDREMVRKSHRSPHRHSSGFSSRSHSRQVSYDNIEDELGKRSELQPTKIVVLKPNLAEIRYASSPSSSSDEFRADRRLPCTNTHSRHKSFEDNRHSRDSRDIKQRRAAMSFEASGFRGYAGDESSSGSDSSSELELVPVVSRTITGFNRKNYHRSLPSKSSVSSVSKEAKRRLSERWKLTHKYEQEIEISRSGTLAEMLATSEREARPASFNGLSFEDGISKRFVEWSEFQEPVGISSSDGWKGSWSRKYTKSKAVMNQESTSGGYTIVLPKGLISRDGLVKGSSSHHGESRLVSRSSYNSSPEFKISPSLSKAFYTNEKVSPYKPCSSFSVDADSDSEDSSDSDDMKTAMSSEALDLSTITSVTDPDISRKTMEEDVIRSSVPEPPQSREGTKEGDQPSPVSVLETSFDEDVSSSSECFESVSADLQGLRMQLQLLKLESAAYNEGAMLVSSDEETEHEELSTKITHELEEEHWKSLYLVDLLANSKFTDTDDTALMATTPIDPSLFDDLEKKYSSSKASTRLERKFLFDQISREIVQILNRFTNPHPWVKSTRVYPKWDRNKIQESLRDLVVRNEEKKPSNNDEMEEWLSMEDEIEMIGREIEEMLTDELIEELMVDAIFV